MAFILERYVLRQAIQAFLLGLFALTGIIFVGMAGALMREDFNIVQALVVWPYMLLYALPFALPIALLCSVVLTFGRMSADNEITAARSSGVRPDRLALPVVALSLVLSVGAFWIYQWVLPTAHRRVDQHKELMVKMAMNSLGVSTLNFEAPPYEIFVRTKDPKTGEWVDVVIVEVKGEMVLRILRARRGQYRLDRDMQAARIVLKDCVVLEPETTEAGVGTLNQWLKTDLVVAGSAFEGAVTMGPSKVTIPVDLSKIVRRSPDRAELKSLPDLVAEMAKMSARLKGAPAVARPKSTKKKLERALSGLAEEISSIEGSLATLKRDMHKLEQEEALAKAAMRNARAERTKLEGESRELTLETKKLERERAAAAKKRNKARLRACRRRLSRIRVRLKDLGRERAKAASRLERLEQTLRGKDAERQGLERDMARARAKSATLAVRHANASRRKDYLEALIEFHSRSAAAASCLVFALIGIPLGVISHRGNIIYALACSMGVVLLIYYPLTMIARLLAADAFVSPAVAFWTPDVVVAGMGLALHALAVRR